MPSDPPTGDTTTGDVDAATVRSMVQHLRPDWDVAAIDRSGHGTSFVATLDLSTPAGPDRAVLKAATAAWVDRRTARAEPRIIDLVDRETAIPVPTVFGYCDDHPDLPAPYYLMEHVRGEDFEGRPDALPPAA